MRRRSQHPAEPTQSKPMRSIESIPQVGSIEYAAAGRQAVAVEQCRAMRSSSHALQLGLGLLCICLQQPYRLVQPA